MSTVDIHPSAIVAAGAELAEGVKIGPYCVIGPHVKIGARTRIEAHCVLEGHTALGEDNHVFPFCSLGQVPQDMKYAGEPTRLTIGHRNTIREYCSFNVGTVQDGGETRVGDDNWIMAYVHVAHDCTVGNHTIFANNATLAGHVVVGDWAILGGHSAVHQFCRIGRKAMIGGMTGIGRDVIPFAMVTGDRGKLRGLNVIGLKRSGCDEHTIKSVTRAYMYIFKSNDGTFEERVQKAKEKFAGNPMVEEQIAFIEEAMHSRRQVLVAE